MTESKKTLEEQLAGRVAELERAEKVQKALYRIAEAASAAQNMQQFYATIHGIVGELMYAENFIIILYDAATNTRSFPYYADSAGDAAPPPGPVPPQSMFARLIPAARSVHFNRQQTEQAIREGAMFGTPSEDFVGVPLTADGRLIGALIVQSYIPGVGYTDDDVRLLEFVARHIATALTRARAIEETRQRNAELQIINSVQQGLASQLDMQAIYELVGNKIKEIFDAQTVMLVTFDHEKNLIYRNYIMEKGRRFHVDPLPISKVWAYFIRNRRTWLVNNNMQASLAQVDPDFTPPAGETPKSALSVPLIIKDELRGAIDLENMDRENAFAESDVRLLETLANSMSIALENARLFDETQRLLKETEQRAAELAIINSVQEALAAKLDIQAIYDSVGDRIREIFKSNTTFIIFHDIENNQIVAAYYIDNGMRSPITSRPYGKGLTELIIESGKPLLFNTKEESTKAGSFDIASPDSDRDLNESFLGIPIFRNGRAIGATSVQSYKQYAYDENDVRLLATLTNAMSVALENARLFDETQRLLKETEQRNAELAIINSVQEGLASKLEMQAIIDLVGDKIRDVFNTQGVGIELYDRRNNLIHYRYVTERGKRQTIAARPPHGFRQHVIQTGRPIVINQDMDRISAEFGNPVLLGEDSKSGIWMPMIVGNDVTGIISLQNMDRESAFADSDVRLLQTLANSLSVALENARLFDETQHLLKETEQRAAELAIINSVQTALASKLDFQGVIEAVGDKIREIFPHEGIVGIALLDSERNMIRLPYFYNMDEGRNYSAEIPLGQGLASIVYATRKPLLINSDLDRRSRELGSVPIGEGEGPSTMKAWLGVPIIVGDEVIGGINLQNSDHENAYTDSDVRLLQTLASSLGVALENARLFDETQRLFKAEQQRAAELAMINSVQEGLASKLEMQAIYDLVGDKIREIFDAETMYIAAVDPHTKLGHFLYFVSLGKRIFDYPPGPATGFGGHVYETQQPLLLNHIDKQVMAEYGSYLQGMENEEEDNYSRSWMGAPLVSGGHAIGVVSIQQKRENAFTESDLNLLTTLVNSMSVALENARLFDETQRLLKETEQRAAELAIINSVQEGLASKLDMQAIYDLVGDKIRDIFDAQAATIASFDHATETQRLNYVIERGRRFYPQLEPPFIDAPGIPFTGLTRLLIRDRKPLLINEDMERRFAEIGMRLIPGTEMGKSGVWVPLMVGEVVSGFIGLSNVDREKAFSESDVNLLTTLANSMSVALENARLFDETQRLLKETEQRAAELAIINSVQEGLALKLDMQAIYDLVGDKIRDIFDAQAVLIGALDTINGIEEFKFNIEKGQRYYPAPRPYDAVRRQLIQTRQPYLNNRLTLEQIEQAGGHVIEGTEAPKSIVFVPLTAGQEVTGYVSLQNVDRYNAFNDSDVRLLQTLANSMSVALENARLFDEIQQRNREITEALEQQTATSEILQVIASSPTDVQPVMNVIVENASHLCAAGFGLLYRLYGEVFSLEAYAGLTEENAEIFRSNPPRLDRASLSGRVALERRAIQIEDVLADAEYVYGAQSGAQAAIGYRTALGVPIMRESEVLGYLAIGRLDVNPFNKREIDLATTFANQAAIAMENVRLFNETTRLLKETEQRAQELATVNTVSNALAGELELNALIELVGKQIRGAFRADIVYVALLDRRTNLIHFPYQVGESFTTLKLGEGLTSKIIETGQPLLINQDVDQQRAQLGATRVGRRARSYLGVPIFVSGKAIGVISVQSTTQEGVFTENDQRLLSTIAANVGVALQNARLFDEIKRQGQYLEAIVQNSPVAIVTVDNDSNVVSWNPGAEQLFGYTREEAIGRDMDDLVANSSEVRDEARNYTKQAMDNQFVHSITKRTRKDKSLVDVELSGVPLPLPTGKSGLVAIYHDITELQRARQEAIAANEAKSAFLATMSHEIRTPMNAVIGMSGLLMDTQLTKEQHDYVETIRNSGDALLAIINDILDFSKIEAGKMELEQQPFDLRECVESALDLVAGRAFEKGLDLAYILDDDVPTGLRGDVTRLRQILLNLLSNSVKFTEKGEVVLTVKNGSTRNELQFTVRDTGIGIPRNRMNKLFESFSQADSSTTRRYGGTGLGLAISKRLAEMMGGTMWAESDGAGKGSTFSFTIQAPTADVPARKTRREIVSAQPALRGKRVLIVDDNATNRRILVLQTQKWGMAPREFESPREALGGVRSGESFDLAILDLQMPEMDGVTLAREIRRNAATQSLPIILLTSLGRREVGAEDVDFAAYLTKPLKPSALFDAVAGVFARHIITPRVEPAKTLDPDFAGRHPLRILLAEDNAVNQKLALRLLEQMGYRADVASNGLEAIESVERQNYDVVLMDVQMPELDGLEATRRIRKKTLTQPYVIAMTANAMQGDREMCLAAGMDDYITKPIRVNELVGALANAKGRARAAGPAAGGRPKAKRPVDKKKSPKATAPKAKAGSRKKTTKR